MFALRSTRQAPRLFVRHLSTAPATYNSIILSNPLPSVTLITLNRPKALNGSSPSPSPTSLRLFHPNRRADFQCTALNSALFHELNAALDAAATDDAIGAVVITGSDKAFAAGADIKEMKDKEFAEVYKEDFLGHWTKMTEFKKPIVAAVSGYAVSLAAWGYGRTRLMCLWTARRRMRARDDVRRGVGGTKLPRVVLTSLSPQVRYHPRLSHRRLWPARNQRASPVLPRAPAHSLPSQLGVIPGAGGTQRLTHALGKSRAMEIVLTGKNFTATDAAAWGLISRVVEGDVVAEAVKVAGVIASKGRVAVQSGKEGVNAGEFVVWDGEWTELMTGYSVRVELEGWASHGEEAVPPALCDREYLVLRSDERS